MELITFLIAFIVLILVITDYKWKPKGGNVLPYRLPIIGHILLFYGKDVHKVLEHWANKTGYDYFTLQVFNQEVVVVNSYDGIYETLVRRGKDLAGRFQSFRIDYVAENSNIVTADYSSEWKKRRNLLHSYMKQYGEGTQQFDYISNSICKDFVNVIENKACYGKYDICIQREVEEAFTNIMASIVIGRKFEHNDCNVTKWLRLSELFHERIVSLNSGWELDLFQWLRHFGNACFRDIQEYTFLKNELFDDIRYEDTKNGESKQQTGLARFLFDDMNKKHINYLDDNIISLLIVDLMVAGISTSPRVLYSFIQVLAKYPDIQGKIYSEIAMVIDRSGSNIITMKDRELMPYTQACLMEIQRYVTLGPVNIPHVAMTDTKILGNTIKKGCIVLTNLWQLHHNQLYWEKPWEFIPERFLDENSKLIHSDHLNRKRVMAFGAGTRVCLGQTLAKSSLFRFSVAILQKFEIKLGNGAEKCENLHDPRNYKFNFLLSPKSQPLKFIPRE